METEREEGFVERGGLAEEEADLVQLVRVEVGVALSSDTLSILAKHVGYS